MTNTWEQHFSDALIKNKLSICTGFSNSYLVQSLEKQFLCTSMSMYPYMETLIRFTISNGNNFSLVLLTQLRHYSINLLQFGWR